jgi:hypothetical protein
MGVFPWLLRMPFSKWAHMIYRPIAMYFAGIIRESAALDKAPQRSTQYLQPAA